MLKIMLPQSKSYSGHSTLLPTLMFMASLSPATNISYRSSFYNLNLQHDINEEKYCHFELDHGVFLSGGRCGAFMVRMELNLSHLFSLNSVPVLYLQTYFAKNPPKGRTNLN